MRLESKFVVFVIFFTISMVAITGISSINNEPIINEFRLNSEPYTVVVGKPIMFNERGLLYFDYPSLLGCSNFHLEYYDNNCIKLDEGYELVGCSWFHVDWDYQKREYIPVNLDDLPIDDQYCLHGNIGVSVHYTDLWNKGWIPDSHFCSDKKPMECEEWHKIVPRNYDGV